jgi:hypothetical protein
MIRLSALVFFLCVSLGAVQASSAPDERSSTKSLEVLEVLSKEEVLHEKEKKHQSREKRLWKVSLGGQYLKQDLVSDFDHSSVEEISQSYTLKASRRTLFKQGEFVFEIEGGFEKSDFDYRSGRAELELDGWSQGVSLSFYPKAFPLFYLNGSYSRKLLEGREFIDHGTGRVGLPTDAELEERLFSLIVNFKLLSFDLGRGYHELNAHGGYSEREWDMNIGWLTNNPESLSVDQPWIGGFSYLWELNLMKYKENSLLLDVSLLDQGVQGSLLMTLDW